jgi:hypothetical protein
MNIAILFSGIAIIVSIITFLYARFQAQKFKTLEIKPSLDFVNKDSDGLILRNVGKGTAFNIIMAQKFPEKDWTNPLRIDSIPANNNFPLKGLDLNDISDLWAICEDFQKQRYSVFYNVKTGQPITGNGKFIATWKDEEIVAYSKKYNNPWFIS